MKRDLDPPPPSFTTFNNWEGFVQLNWYTFIIIPLSSIDLSTLPLWGFSGILMKKIIQMEYKNPNWNEANQLAILQAWLRIWIDRTTENKSNSEAVENMQYSNMNPYLFCDVINVRTGLTSKSIKWRPWAFLHG